MQSSGSTYRCNRQHLDTAPDHDKTVELPETNIREELPIHLSSQAPTSKTRSEANPLQPSPKKLHSVESRSTPSPGQSSPKAHHSEESCNMPLAKRTPPFENQRSEAVLWYDLETVSAFLDCFLSPGTVCRLIFDVLYSYFCYYPFLYFNSFLAF